MAKPYAPLPDSFYLPPYPRGCSAYSCSALRACCSSMPGFGGDAKPRTSHHLHVPSPAPRPSMAISLLPRRCCSCCCSASSRVCWQCSAHCDVSSDVHCPCPPTASPPAVWYCTTPWIQLRGGHLQIRMMNSSCTLTGAGSQVLRAAMRHAQVDHTGGIRSRAALPPAQRALL